MKRFSPASYYLGLLLLLVATLHPRAWGQASGITSIVVFGDSLSDTGNDAAVSGALYGPLLQVPGPYTGYTFGRFTDGLDTLPAAHLYTGVWIEQLAALLPQHPTVTNSLAGGRNYAYGYATTNTGTGNLTYGPGNVFSFPVKNMGQQVSDYLATNPTINSSVLFVVWGGANDLIAATSTADIVAAATRDAALVQQLIAAGATNFIVPYLPPLGLVPRFNGTAASAAQGNAAAVGFNQALAAALAQVAAANAGRSINLYTLDTSTVFNAIVAAPKNYGFANVTASSQLQLIVNPDTYLFWDDLHPTTAGHRLLALNALRLLNPAVTTNTALQTSASTVNLNTSITLTATVTNAGGTTDTPIGTVTFLDGSTTLGTALVSGSGSSATATFSTATLSAGTHSIQARFSGVNGFGSSASTSLTETVVPPTYAATLFPSSVTVNGGNSAATILSITPSGGYLGSFTVTCGSIPAPASCRVQNPNLTITGTGAVSTAILLNTNMAANSSPSFFRNDNPVVLAFLGFPMFGGLAFAARRRTAASLRLTLLIAVASLSLLGLSACGSGKGASGTYTVPITVTPATGTATTLTFSVTVQ